MLLGFAAQLLVPAQAALAQDAAAVEAEDDTFICMTVLRLWTGSIEDIRAIEEEPVPRSYREGQQSCGGPLQASDLVGWHLRFGTAKSALAAIAFLEKREAEDSPEIARI